MQLNQYRITQKVDPKGLLIAWSIILLWAISLVFWIQFEISWTNPLTYLGILIQMHLYTGLFITAHDAMHGVVSSHKQINHATGWIAAILFSYNFYWKLFPKHHQHHRHVATDEDPDYHASGNFLIWYLSFIRQYVSIWQILLMAVSFNVLKLWLPTENLIVFWMLPAILSTLQLFYFGTYLPHRGESDNAHHSRSQAKNHVWAFLSCYFFGYHFEHHDSPGTPWWRLWREKEKQTA
ncbi:MAG TPA: fatty acid desaturase [Algoriphagus sp.]|mgnify:CR=1 FL=1|jgi:beta-carotene ketolase (CrtW type)|uniref:fatty acid desaturase n=1 Tax=unclassified Algoriphagus TaxID=2641541 RepID=UPI000C5BA57D|nr:MULTISPECIES: fatty acid desaturase [unclassified Algoriphagus]MAL12184.1 fatty acid desaturase [Algoriphagus sp.]MAN86970.1 fatty acid desaturase [Algoriphagus sp.]QYH40424.1 fatty acid desaturase [Algoriphagus sp. NBT04N3]HAD51864.1 fatty acid desaturase [Algoriphagus sp.]HAS59601.1 fatty acid desaturase [Algoriphagus sp.]|tara:strand:+ start:11412 stop:12122 length:711 start_codon:yes stop_codon:yes gene_type:complete